MKKKIITVFEHQSIKLNRDINESQLKALQSHYGHNGVPYFSLIDNGIKFNQYVGVIQVGNLVIEVLPKADKISDNYNDEQNRWRDILIEMLLSVDLFDVRAPTYSTLALKPNNILEFYFKLFIIELEMLMHQGLLKKYRQKEGNATALKGRLQFSKQIQNNVTHQERFYVRYTTYDNEHQLHSILYKTIQLLRKINTNEALHGQIGALFLNFPEMPDINVSKKTFDRIVYNRKSQNYRSAIEIARLLLLHFHPDVISGTNHLLALMFDMNRLWEEFVYVSLKRHKGFQMTIRKQFSKNFWRSEQTGIVKIRPDIVIVRDLSDCFVFDTKWKMLGNYRPSVEDLRQMYVYHDYYHAKQVALIYPGHNEQKITGNYINRNENTMAIDKCCTILSIPVPSPMNIKKWQQQIANICINL